MCALNPLLKVNNKYFIIGKLKISYLLRWTHLLSNDEESGTGLDTTPLLFILCENRGSKQEPNSSVMNVNQPRHVIDHARVINHI